MDKIILPVVGFEMKILMNTSFGKLHELNGGILMGIQRKFWIGILIYAIFSWCLAFYIMRITYN